MKNKIKRIVLNTSIVSLIATSSGCATPVDNFTPIKYSVEDTGYRPGKGWYQQPRCYRRGS